jgi:hypothetical protein
LNLANKGNILYVVPTNKWSTRERVALKDMMIAISEGYTVYLSTNLDSYLSKLAIANGIEIFPIQEHFLNSITKFHKHYPLSNILKKINLDIVHCYDFNFIFSLAFQLRALNLTSLVITQDHTVDKPLQRFIYRPLISRIDFLILLNKHLKNDILGNLGLPLKKIDYFGMGLKISDPENPSVIELNLKAYQEFFLAGTYLSPELDNLVQIEPLFLALKIINQSPPGGVLSKLLLITDVDFKDLRITKDLREKIEEIQIQDEVLFVSTKDIEGIMTKLSLWISNEPNELIEDYAILALDHEVPVVLARNFCSKEMLSEFEGIGESYKLFDSRELRQKWTKIVLGKTLYKDKVRLFKFFIEKEHDFRNYKVSLSKLYEKMTIRRQRVFKKS